MNTPASHSLPQPRIGQAALFEEVMYLPSTPNPADRLYSTVGSQSYGSSSPPQLPGMYSIMSFLMRESLPLSSAQYNSNFSMQSSAGSFGVNGACTAN